MNSKIATPRAPLTPVFYIAASYPLLVLVCQGLVPALKGSAIGLDSFIDRADHFAGALSHFGAFALLLLGAPSFWPMIVRTSMRWSAILFLPVALFSYLVLVGASRSPLPSELIAATSVSLGLGGTVLLATDRESLRGRGPLLVSAVSVFVSGLVGLYDGSTRSIELTLGALTALVGLAASLTLIHTSARASSSSLLVASLLVAHVVGAAVVTGHSKSNFVGWLARALSSLAEGGNLGATASGAVALPVFVASCFGSVTRNLRVTIAASATLLAISPPSPLGIATLATLMLRIYIDTVSQNTPLRSGQVS